MKGIKLPATIRWAITNCLLIWLAMSLYRGFLLGIFLNGNPSEILSLLGGMLVDAGIMSSILVFYLLLSLSPVLHPFKTRSGKFFGYLYFIFLGLLIALAYAFDLIFIKAIHYRLYGSKLLAIFEDPNETEVFFKNISLTPLFLGIFLFLWVWGLVIVKLHYYISRLPRVPNKAKRIRWKVSAIVIGTLLGIYAISQGSAIKSPELNMREEPADALQANPLLTFFLV